MTSGTLAREIRKRVSADQRMRKRFAANKGRWNPNIDRVNTLWLKKIVAEYGWPTISLVGKTASGGAWLLAQHADHDLRFQEKVLALMQKIYRSNPQEIKASNLAYLTDRILVHKKRPQIYGTQFVLNEEGDQMIPSKIRDAVNVNKRRKKVGLGSLVHNQARINRQWGRWKINGKKNK